MPNYFKVKNAGVVEVSGATIEDKKAAEKFVAKQLDIPVENVEEITYEEFKKLDKQNDDFQKAGEMLQTAIMPSTNIII